MVARINDARNDFRQLSTQMPTAVTAVPEAYGLFPPLMTQTRTFTARLKLTNCSNRLPARLRVTREIPQAVRELAPAAPQQQAPGGIAGLIGFLTQLLSPLAEGFGLFLEFLGFGLELLRLALQFLALGFDPLDGTPEGLGQRPHLFGSLVGVPAGERRQEFGVLRGIGRKIAVLFHQRHVKFLQPLKLEVADWKEWAEANGEFVGLARRLVELLSRVPGVDETRLGKNSTRTWIGVELRRSEAP